MSDYLKIVIPMLVIITVATAYTLLLVWLASMWGLWLVPTGLLVAILLMPIPMIALVNRGIL